MTSVLAPIADKLGKLIRMLSSNQDGDVLNAARAIVRTLDTAGLDVHTLAANIGGDDKKFSEKDAREIYQRGVAMAGRRPSRSRRAPFSTTSTSTTIRPGTTSRANARPTAPGSVATLPAISPSAAWKSAAVPNCRRSTASSTPC